ncbi:flavoprotein [Streptosporangium carneum]|uniref:Flavoprotein n=1 Tax=Streptosporangium carneum TaxID=47481 RepID=A0A9W6MH68_9ACTN|nr:flavoprotein [Streptosporangium carneum]GLK13857.1 flavoprotein [Streptosporangium carneum]
MDRRAVLYVVACAAPATAGLARLVMLAQQDGWQVHVVATPMGTRFLDAVEIEHLTGDRVHSAYRMPGEPKGLPPADAVVVAPATFNTINKWAAGIADTFAVGLLCEVTGFGVPILAVPLLKEALARHPAFSRSMETLREIGVRVLFDPDASAHARMPSWESVMQELRSVVGDQPPQR